MTVCKILHQHGPSSQPLECHCWKLRKGRENLWVKQFYLHLVILSWQIDAVLFTIIWLGCLLLTANCYLHFLQTELSVLSEEIHFQIRLCGFNRLAPQLILVNKNIWMLLWISLDRLWRTTDLTPLDFWRYMKEYIYQEESQLQIIDAAACIQIWESYRGQQILL